METMKNTRYTIVISLKKLTNPPNPLWLTTEKYLRVMNKLPQNGSENFLRKIIQVLRRKT